MSETLKWTYQASAVGGPTLVGKGELQVEAYLKLNITVPAGGEALAVELLPGEGGTLQFLIINPKSPSSQLSYSVGQMQLRWTVHTY
jgi:hypothetical protein